MKLISLTGGVKDSASKEEIILFQRKPNRVSMVTPLDMGKTIDASDTSQDLLPTPYQAVYVSKTAIENLNPWVDHYSNGVIYEKYTWRSTIE